MPSIWGPFFLVYQVAWYGHFVTGIIGSVFPGCIRGSVVSQCRRLRDQDDESQSRNLDFQGGVSKPVHRCGIRRKIGANKPDWRPEPA